MLILNWPVVTCQPCLGSLFEVCVRFGTVQPVHRLDDDTGCGAIANHTQEVHKWIPKGRFELPAVPGQRLLLLEFQSWRPGQAIKLTYTHRIQQKHHPSEVLRASGVCKQVRVALGCWQGTNNINVNILSKRASGTRNACIGALTRRQILLYMLYSSTRLCDDLMSWWDSLPGVPSWGWECVRDTIRCYIWIAAEGHHCGFGCQLEPAGQVGIVQGHGHCMVSRSFNVADVCHEFGNKKPGVVPVRVNVGHHWTVVPVVTCGQCWGEQQGKQPTELPSEGAVL